MSTPHTPGPWTQGTTLHTEQTRRWTALQIEENNRVERRMVFAGFTPIDQGRGRQLIAICEREEDARLVAAAPDLLKAARLVQAWYDAESNPQGTTFYKRMDMCRESEEALRAAIAKAEGEQEKQS